MHGESHMLVSITNYCPRLRIPEKKGLNSRPVIEPTLAVFVPE